MTRRHAALPAPSTRAGWFRALAVLATAAVLAVIVVPALAGGRFGPLGSREAAAADPASALVSMINSARASRGLAPVQVSGDLAAVAAERAAIMARSGTLSHTPDLGGRICCEVWVGENSGYGDSPSQVHQLFMNSAPHAANILYGPANQVGVGVASGGGWLWVAEVFRATGGGGGSGGGGSSGSGSTGTASRTDVAVTTSRSATRSALPVRLTPQQLLGQRLSTLRADLRSDLARMPGSPDPLLLALRYPVTLGSVSR